jgi:mRNA interferase YafQ
MAADRAFACVSRHKEDRGSERANYWQETIGRRPDRHSLSGQQCVGEWSDHRDCHIRPDLVLIYRKPDDHNLELVRLGSHSELGL